VFIDHVKPSAVRGRALPDAVEFQSASTGGGAVSLLASAATVGAVSGGVAGRGPVGFTPMPPLGTIPSGAASGLGDAEIGARVAQARAEMLAMATALEAFFVDNGRLPGFAIGPGSYNGSLGEDVLAAALPSLDNSLLRPTPYVVGERYPVDPFCPQGKATFAYWAIQPGQADPAGNPVGNNTFPGWILASPGPDGDFDLNGEWDVYDPRTAPTPRLLTGANKKGSAFTYDPTNGMRSDGDIWRVKQ